MIDLYLKAANEAAMNAALDEAGLIIEQQVSETKDGEPVFRMVHAPGVSLDVIGSITRVIGYDEAGEPIFKEYPEWHVNVRAELSKEQLEMLNNVIIAPPEVPFRVWA